MESYFTAYVVDQNNSRWGGFEGDSPEEAIQIADNQIKQKRHLDEGFFPKEILVFLSSFHFSFPCDVRLPHPPLPEPLLEEPWPDEHH